MVFVSFEVEKMRMFLVQSVVRWCWVLVRSWGAVVSFPMWSHWPKDRFQLAPVSWPSCRQQASLFMHGHGRAAFPILLQILLLFQILGHWCRIFQGIKGPPTSHSSMGAGIAQWLERRTRDWKVAGSNPCWNGGRIFFSRVDFLCWLLFRYPFHPRVTTVARKKSRSFCQKCRCQVTAKHAYTLRM